MIKACIQKGEEKTRRKATTASFKEPKGRKLAIFDRRSSEGGMLLAQTTEEAKNNQNESPKTKGKRDSLVSSCLNLIETSSNLFKGTSCNQSPNSAKINSDPAARPQGNRAKESPGQNRLFSRKGSTPNQPTEISLTVSSLTVTPYTRSPKNTKNFLRMPSEKAPHSQIPPRKQPLLGSRIHKDRIESHSNNKSQLGLTRNAQQDHFHHFPKNENSIKKNQIVFDRKGSEKATATNFPKGSFFNERKSSFNQKSRREKASLPQSSLGQIKQGPIAKITLSKHEYDHLASELEETLLKNRVLEEKLAKAQAGLISSFQKHEELQSSFEKMKEKEKELEETKRKIASLEAAKNQKKKAKNFSRESIKKRGFQMLVTSVQREKIVQEKRWEANCRVVFFIFQVLKQNRPRPRENARYFQEETKRKKKEVSSKLKKTQKEERGSLPYGIFEQLGENERPIFLRSKSSFLLEKYFRAWKNLRKTKMKQAGLLKKDKGRPKEENESKFGEGFPKDKRNQGKTCERESPLVSFRQMRKKETLGNFLKLKERLIKRKAFAALTQKYLHALLEKAAKLKKVNKSLWMGRVDSESRVQRLEENQRRIIQKYEEIAKKNSLLAFELGESYGKIRKLAKKLGENEGKEKIWVSKIQEINDEAERAMAKNKEYKKKLKSIRESLLSVQTENEKLKALFKRGAIQENDQLEEKKSRSFHGNKEKLGLSLKMSLKGEGHKIESPNDEAHFKKRALSSRVQRKLSMNSIRSQKSPENLKEKHLTHKKGQNDPGFQNFKGPDVYIEDDSLSSQESNGAKEERAILWMLESKLEKSYRVVAVLESENNQLKAKIRKMEKTIRLFVKESQERKNKETQNEFGKTPEQMKSSQHKELQYDLLRNALLIESEKKLKKKGKKRQELESEDLCSYHKEILFGKEKMKETKGAKKEKEVVEVYSSLSHEITEEEAISEKEDQISPAWKKHQKRRVPNNSNKKENSFEELGASQSHESLNGARVARESDEEQGEASCDEMEEEAGEEGEMYQSQEGQRYQSESDESPVEESRRVKRTPVRQTEQNRILEESFEDGEMENHGDNMESEEEFWHEVGNENCFVEEERRTRKQSSQADQQKERSFNSEIFYEASNGSSQQPYSFTRSVKETEVEPTMALESKNNNKKF